MEFCWVNGRYIFRNDYINRIFFCNILMLFASIFVREFNISVWRYDNEEVPL